MDFHTEKQAWNYTASTFFADTLPFFDDYDIVIITGVRDAVLPDAYASVWGMQAVNNARDTAGAAQGHIILYRLDKFTLDTTSTPAHISTAGDMALTDGGLYAVQLIEKATNRKIAVASLYCGTWDKVNNKTTMGKTFKAVATAIAAAFPNADATIISSQFITAKYTCAGQGDMISALDNTAWTEGYDLRHLSETPFVVSDVTYAHYVFTYSKDDALAISDAKVVELPAQSTDTGGVSFTATVK